MTTSPLIQELMTFLDSSPTAWHVVQNMRARLQKAGFQELSEQSFWNIQPCHYTINSPHASSLISFAH
jgi:aspartyl aminopeptidase